MQRLGSETTFVVFSTNRPDLLERFCGRAVHELDWENRYAAALSDEQVSILMNEDLPENMWISFKNVSVTAPIPEHLRDRARRAGVSNLPAEKRRGCIVTYDPRRDVFDTPYYRANVSEPYHLDRISAVIRVQHIDF